MKNLVLTSALFALSLTTSAQSVDPAASKVLWTATKVTGDHTGNVPVKEGTITVADGKLAAAHMVIDMTGITCIDIENEGANTKLVNHLKSADFFDVENHTTATFKSISVEAIAGATPGKPNHAVTGDLTIKGITHPVTFNCLFWTEGSTARSAASFTFDRSKYEIKYRSGSFFPDLGDKVISDTVSLTFDVTAK
jgi:polyisoprenoid-binding protein YceI